MTTGTINDSCADLLSTAQEIDPACTLVSVVRLEHATRVKLAPTVEGTNALMVTNALRRANPFYDVALVEVYSTGTTEVHVLVNDAKTQRALARSFVSRQLPFRMLAVASNFCLVAGAVSFVCLVRM